MSDHAPDRLFMDGRYDDAAASLREGLEKQGQNGKDELLYLLDLGLSLHAAGKYEESNEVLLKADQIAEIKDYTSLSTEGATLLSSDNIKHYKGEDFEKVLINTYLAMNFALLGKHEGALVEAKRVNRKLAMMVTEGQRKYKQNAFALYLSGIIYESEKSFNDAYIDYKRAYELMPDFPGIGRDLWRTARMSGLDEEADRWASEFKIGKEEKRELVELAKGKGKAEIVVIYENGLSPVKRQNPHFRTLPKFYPRFNPVGSASVEAWRDDTLLSTGIASSKMVIARTAVLHDIEATAIQNLDEKYGGLVAKKIAGVVAKEVVASQIERRLDNPFLGLVARVALYASDQADLRSWNLLPRDLQIARLVVVPGKYRVKLKPLGSNREIPEQLIEVTAGHKSFLAFRYVPTVWGSIH